MFTQIIALRLVNLLTLCFMLYLNTTSVAYAQKSVRTLTVLNWSDYIDPQVVAEFEKINQVNVQDVFYETDDARDKFITQTDGKGYDVGIVSRLMLDTYRKKGWIDSINQTQVPNLKYIDESKKVSNDGVSGYGVPYTWGTLGIAYRTDLVEQPIKTWMDLFQPQVALHGKIVMIKSARQLLGAALNAKGYSVNSIDTKELAEAEALLLSQKPHVLTYGYIQLTDESVLVNGIAAATIAYSGDALTLQNINPNIKYVLPKEGSSIWSDDWVVFTHSNNKDLAYQFLNFLNEPKIAAQNAEYINMATPNLAAFDFLSDAFLEDPIIYPKLEQLKALEPHAKLQGRSLRTRSQIFNRVIK